MPLTRVKSTAPFPKCNIASAFQFTPNFFGTIPLRPIFPKRRISQLAIEIVSPNCRRSDFGPTNFFFLANFFFLELVHPPHFPNRRISQLAIGIVSPNRRRSDFGAQPPPNFFPGALRAPQSRPNRARKANTPQIFFPARFARLVCSFYDDFARFGVHRQEPRY